MPDMRDELVLRGSFELRTDQRYRKQSPDALAATVLDSIPPGSFKLDEKTWVRLERIGRGHFRRGRFELHTEDVELTCDPSPAVYTEVVHAE